MIAYVSFVAITNLLLGMALARYLSPTIARPRYTGIRTRVTTSPPPVVTEEPSADDSTDVLEVPPQVEAVSAPEPSVEAEEKDKPTLAALWNEFAAQLRDVSERIHYCRAAQDITLAQQAAMRLKSFVREWYAQFEECLQHEQPDEASQSAASGQTLSSVEMFAAQLETTLSNIDALDYSEPVDDVLDALNRELETLDRQRRGFAKSAESDS